MADGFIVRKGGVAVDITAAPSINFVSKTDSEIVVTFTNNDAAEAEVFFGITSTLTDTVTLAAAATSSNITFSGLDADTAFTVSAFAIVTDPTSKKIKSEIVTTVITTDAPIFTAATGGTTLEYDSGGKRFKSHTFTSDGTFTVTTVGDNVDDRNKVDFLIIAGGAGGGGLIGAGGGAGGYRTTLGTSGAGSAARDKVVVTAQAHSIDVGSGGAGDGPNANGNNGTASSGLGVTTVGGGGGGYIEVRSNGLSGGSGGGAGSHLATSNFTGGSGTALEGFKGGDAPFTGTIRTGGGGGGGAGQAGTNGSRASGDFTGGKGGNGLANSLRTGSAETRAGGGGGSLSISSSGDGGTGGGGRAATSNELNGVSATANTGSGGGGGSGGSTSTQTGGNGANGLVVIRYEIAPSV